MKAVPTQALREALQGVEGEILWKEPLRNHTTIKIGGPADVLVIPKDLGALTRLIGQARNQNVPVFVLGGSNLLVLDGGIRGIVVKLARLQSITDLGDREIEVEGGVLLSRLARHAAERKLSGLEFALGIPGTVGGAVVMNAGTREGEMSDLLQQVDVLTWSGERLSLDRKNLSFGYRRSRLPAGVVLGARLRLLPAGPAEIHRRMQGFIDRRKQTQPLTWPNAGSVFKNPNGQFAAKLIEAVGLKGHRIGDAQVSDLHANFIINRGRATARDTLKLIRLIGKRVEDRTDITLELEWRIVGRG
ncbi:MAG TPA: UDP-N-acetylmuramate dehydrogenase [Nitrospiria bacterium]